MDYILVGKNAVYETIVAALVFLQKKENLAEELKGNSVFGDLDRDKKREPIFIGSDNRGNRIYTLGTQNYKLIEKIVGELSRVAAQPDISLQVINIEIKGDAFTYRLAYLARLPLIGAWFGELAKRWVISRKSEIMISSRNIINSMHQLEDFSPAAKPLK